MDPRKETEECGKCESKSSGLFNVCKTSSKDCRPHLTRVFSELKDLYGMRDVKKKEFQVDERCERKLNGEGVGRKSPIVSDKMVKEKVAEKSSTRQNDAKLVKNLHSSVKMCKNRK